MFNNINLLDGTSTTAKLQIGANAQVSSLGLSLNSTGSTWNLDKIRSYLTRVDSAINLALSKRADIGALQNRLESALDHLTVMKENIQSESRIRDLDIAKETAQMTKYQILQQASASILSQANQVPQLALSLIRG